MSESLDAKLDKISQRILERDISVLPEIELLIIETHKSGETLMEAELHGFKATIYRILRQNDKALLTLDKAETLLDLSIERHIKILAWIHKLRSSVYQNLGNYLKSDEYNLKALEIYEKKNDPAGAANVMNDLGQGYLIRNEHSKADLYLNKALKYFLKLDIGTAIWMIYYSLGSLKLKTKENTEAAEYFNNAIKNVKKINNEVGLGLSLTGLSNVLLSQKNHQKALIIIEQAISIAQKTKNQSLIETSKLSKISILLKLKMSKEALSILNSLTQKDMPEPTLLSVNASFSAAYEMENDFEKSLQYLHENHELKEKFFGIEAQKNTEILEAKFQNKLKENEKEILRLQKVEMEQKALRAQLNPHFFFNSLNSINKFIVDNDPENASKFLFKFSSLMRKTLENSEESFITIEEEVEYLQDYLSIEQLRFNYSILKYEITIDEEIEEDFLKIPTMMLQPYVENCIKHGINGIENGFIAIDFKLLTDESILCSIKDNGKGRSAKQSEHKSMGTSILEKRINVLNEKDKSNFSIEVIDLIENNIQNGTLVKLIFPTNFVLS